MAYEDLKEHGSETAVKAAGKLKQQGKTYESQYFFVMIESSDAYTIYTVNDGDIAYWKSGA